MKKERVIKILISLTLILFCVPCIAVGAEDYGDETMPESYGEFIESLPSQVKDALPDKVTSEYSSEINEAAQSISSPQSILSVLLSVFKESIGKIIPTFAAVLGIVFLTAVFYAFSSHLPTNLSRGVEFCSRLCMWTSISGVSISFLSRLQEYFDRLFSAVASFIPLSATLYAMGGNLTVAATSSATLTTILTVCQFVLTKTVIPVFCVCLALTLLSTIDGTVTTGDTIGGSVRKWYIRVVSFVMMILTSSLMAQTIIASRADNMAMKGAKFAASSFIPLSGGTVATTLGTLASSVEIMRGAVGVIGVFVIILMLLPVIVELAVMRAAYAVVEFVAGLLSCPHEKKLLSQIGELYGYLEGVAVISSIIFIIAFAIFASVGTPLS